MKQLLTLAAAIACAGFAQAGVLTLNSASTAGWTGSQAIVSAAANTITTAAFPGTGIWSISQAISNSGAGPATLKFDNFSADDEAVVQVNGNTVFAQNVGNNAVAANFNFTSGVDTAMLFTTLATNTSTAFDISSFMTEGVNTLSIWVNNTGNANPLGTTATAGSGGPTSVTFSGSMNYTNAASSVPLPGSLFLLGLGLILFAAASRIRRPV